MCSVFVGEAFCKSEIDQVEIQGIWVKQEIIRFQVSVNNLP